VEERPLVEERPFRAAKARPLNIWLLAKRVSLNCAICFSRQKNCSVQADPFLISGKNSIDTRFFLESGHHSAPTA
jgi:hypothetical protein